MDEMTAADTEKSKALWEKCLGWKNTPAMHGKATGISIRKSEKLAGLKK